MSWKPNARQITLLRFVRGYQLANGFSPTVKEMAAGIGTRSMGYAHHLLCQLEENGCIRRLPNRERAVELLIDISVPRAPDGAPLHVVPGVC